MASEYESEWPVGGHDHRANEVTVKPELCRSSILMQKSHARVCIFCTAVNVQRPLALTPLIRAYRNNNSAAY